MTQRFHEFFTQHFLTIFLVKSKLSAAKKCKTTTFSRVLHPKKSTIFSGNQSWIFGQKIKISNSVRQRSSNFFQPSFGCSLFSSHLNVKTNGRRGKCIKSSICLSYFSEPLRMEHFHKLVSRKRRWKQFTEAIVGLLTIFCRWNTLTYMKSLHRHFKSSIKMLKINLQLGTSKYLKL